MNKTDFLARLLKNIRYLPIEEKEAAFVYYSELFEEDLNMAKTLDPEEVARNIVGDYAKKESKNSKEGLSKILIIILSIFAAPMALPMIIVVASPIFVLSVVVATVIFKIVITSSVFLLTGLFSVFRSFMFMPTSFFDFAFVLSSGITFIGIGLMLLPFSLHILKITTRKFQSIFSRILKRK